jgi:hypothetical protein
MSRVGTWPLLDDIASTSPVVAGRRERLPSLQHHRSSELCQTAVILLLMPRTMRSERIVASAVPFYNDR